MEIVADILLAAGALGAGFYCFVLSRRLVTFSNLENGVGSAIGVLSSQVKELESILHEARDDVTQSSKKLDNLTNRAEKSAERIELLLASMHDLPHNDTSPNPAPSDAVFLRHSAGGS